MLKYGQAADSQSRMTAHSEVHSPISPPSRPVIKIILVTSVYTAPILFQKAASLPSHPNESVSTPTQRAFLINFANSKSPVTVRFFSLNKNYSAMVKTINCNALKIPMAVELNEKFPLHATV